MRNRVTQADRNAGQRTDGLTSEKREALRRLRRENRVLREERETLKEAAAWLFARETGSIPSKDSSSCRRIGPRSSRVVPGAGVSASGYCAWLVGPASARARAEANLTDRVRAIHARSPGTYGASRVHAELVAEKIGVGRKRIVRLIRAACVQGASRRKRMTTTVRDRDARPAPDLVKREFAADGLNRLWVADIAYVPTRTGFLCVAVGFSVGTGDKVSVAVVTLFLRGLDPVAASSHRAVRVTVVAVRDFGTLPEQTCATHEWMGPAGPPRHVR